MDQATGVLTLTEFLLARIAEDEDEAQRAASMSSNRTFERDNYGCLLIQPARVLADCEAKREVVRLYEVSDSKDMPVDAWVLMRRAMATIAAVYSEHPDFRPEWRP